MTNTARLQLSRILTKAAFTAQPNGESPLPDEWVAPVATASGALMGGTLGNLGDFFRAESFHKLQGAEQDLARWNYLSDRLKHIKDPVQAEFWGDLIKKRQNAATAALTKSRRNPLNILNRLLGRHRFMPLPVLAGAGALAGGLGLRSHVLDKMERDKARTAAESVVSKLVGTAEKINT